MIALQAIERPAGAADAEAALGIHATHCVQALPAGWQPAAIAADGRVVAATDPGRRLVALAFRPDSVLSSRRQAGLGTLRAALAWLIERAT